MYRICLCLLMSLETLETDTPWWSFPCMWECMRCDKYVPINGWRWIQYVKASKLLLHSLPVLTTIIKSKQVQFVSDHKCITFNAPSPTTTITQKCIIHSRVFNEQSTATFSCYSSNLANCPPYFASINDQVSWFNDVCTPALDFSALYASRAVLVINITPWINDNAGQQTWMVINTTQGFCLVVLASLLIPLFLAFLPHLLMTVKSFLLTSSMDWSPIFPWLFYPPPHAGALFYCLNLLLSPCRSF